MTKQELDEMEAAVDHLILKARLQKEALASVREDIMLLAMRIHSAKQDLPRKA